MNKNFIEKYKSSDEDEKTTEVKRKRRRPKRLTGDNEESPKAQQPGKPQQNINKGTTPTQNNSAENQHKSRRPRHRRSHKPTDGKQTTAVKE